MNNVVQLGDFGEDDKNYQSFIESLKEDVDSAVFLVEKSDGNFYVGSNFENRKDLVYALYKLQGLIQSIVDGGE